MPKKSYSGGFRLTLVTARRLAVQQFGTAKGLGPDRATCLDGYFRMKKMGNLFISIRPDMGMSGCIVVSSTLQKMTPILASPLHFSRASNQSISLQIQQVLLS